MQYNIEYNRIYLCLVTEGNPCVLKPKCLPSCTASQHQKHITSRTCSAQRGCTWPKTLFSGIRILGLLDSQKSHAKEYGITL